MKKTKKVEVINSQIRWVYKMRNKQRIKFAAFYLVMIFAFVLISACGRITKESTVLESSASKQDEKTDSVANEKQDPLTTEQILKNKKLKQFERAGADLSVLQEKDVKNILIIGQDRRAGDKSEMRSDSMMIFSINMNTNEINLVSLMRDMYIPCADGKEGMINMTYLNGGAELLSETIEMNFGIHIDHYIETDFWRFMNLFDLIGSVDVELTAEEANYINDMSKNHRVPHYDYGEEKPVWTLQPGVNSLDPEQMLSFCRVRKDIGGDWGRTDRQRRFIIATYNKLNNMSYAGLIRLIKEGAHYLNTDMGIPQMLGFFYYLKKCDFSQFHGYLIPLEGTYTQEVREEDLHVLIPRIEENRDAIQQYIYGN